MFKYLLMILWMINMLMFNKMKHPLSMGLMLVFQTLIYCMMINYMNESSWFSYMLFLMFISGMLILFIYMTTLNSNEMFNFSYNFMSMMILLPTIILMTYNEFFILTNLKEMMILNMNWFYKENLMLMMKIFNYPMNFSTMLIIIYLLITLIISIKITNFNSGTLRKMK